MGLKKGYYSLCQYDPYYGRREPANVGVLLIHPSEGFKEARFLDSFAHLRWRFGDGFEEQHVMGLTNTVSAWINAQPVTTSLEEWEAFRGRLGNELKMTPLSWVRFEDAAAEVERLFGELVRPLPLCAFQPGRVVFEVYGSSPRFLLASIQSAIRQSWPQACALPRGDDEVWFFRDRACRSALAEGGALPSPEAFLQLNPMGDNLWACLVFAKDNPEIQSIMDSLNTLSQLRPWSPGVIRFQPVWSPREPYVRA